VKVLLIHNFYQSSSPSGEDIVYENEIELLRRNSVDVITYDKDNDDIVNGSVTINTAARTIWSNTTYREIENLIKKEKPDIAHLHNIWYLISPSAYYACKDAGVPVVQTLHNFRMFCANGLLMRNGKICEDCVGMLPWRAAIHGCFRDSKLYSLAVALAEGFHKFKKTWNNKIDAYIALTEFGRNKFIECGLPESKIFVKPNFLSHPPDPFFDYDNYTVFLGRLSEEKGVTTLFDAVKLLNTSKLDPVTVKVIGDGPLRKQLENRVIADELQNVEIVGRKSFSECMEILMRSRFLVMPALCYENFPMTIREAFAYGKPVIASRLGAMASIVEDGKTGLLFEPGNAEDLATKMEWMCENEDACVEMGKNAREQFETKYTAEKNYEILMNIYRKAIQHGRGNNYSE